MVGICHMFNDQMVGALNASAPRFAAVVMLAPARLTQKRCGRCPVSTVMAMAINVGELVISMGYILFVWGFLSTYNWYFGPQLYVYVIRIYIYI